MTCKLCGRVEPLKQFTSARMADAFDQTLRFHIQFACAGTSRGAQPAAPVVAARSPESSKAPVLVRKTLHHELCHQLVPSASFGKSLLSESSFSLLFIFVFSSKIQQKKLQPRPYLSDYALGLRPRPHTAGYPWAQRHSALLFLLEAGAKRPDCRILPG